MKCPKCSREVVNRRKKNCEFCNHLLPVNMVFTDDQKRKLEQMNDSERKKYREWNETMDNTTNKDGGTGGFDGF